MESFDWVTQRAKCSARSIFYKLQKAVEEDVKLRGKLRTGPIAPHYGFRFDHAGDSFRVELTGSNVTPASVNFKLDGFTITVSDEKGSLLFKATPTLNDQGECRLKIKGCERELWRVRSMALETLFFETIAPDWWAEDAIPSSQ